MHQRVLAVAVMFLVSVVLANGGTAVSYAAGKEETSKTKSVRSQEPKQVFDAHEAYVRYHFKDADMDFTFGSLVLGATVNHGCEIGEEDLPRTVERRVGDLFHERVGFAIEDAIALLDHRAADHHLVASGAVAVDRAQHAAALDDRGAGLGEDGDRRVLGQGVAQLEPGARGDEPDPGVGAHAHHRAAAQPQPAAALLQ